MTSYSLNSNTSRDATVARMRMLTGDAYASQGRTLFTDEEILWFLIEIEPGWQPLARKALGFMNPEALPATPTDTDDRLAGTEADFRLWNTNIRQASAEACLSLSMRNPEWSPGRHAAYRTRALELLPATLDLKRR